MGKGHEIQTFLESYQVGWHLKFGPQMSGILTAQNFMVISPIVAQKQWWLFYKFRVWKTEEQITVHSKMKTISSHYSHDAFFDSLWNLSMDRPVSEIIPVRQWCSRECNICCHCWCYSVFFYAQALSQILNARGLFLLCSLFVAAQWGLSIFLTGCRFQSDARRLPCLCLTFFSVLKCQASHCFFLFVNISHFKAY